MTDRRQSAESLALEAFVWIAEQEDLLGAFLGSSGFDPHDIGAAVQTPEFLAAALDFLLAEDARVMAFCDARGMKYTEPMQARFALPGGDAVHWT